MRRLRKSDVLRRLVRETRLHTDDLIAPLFVIEGKNSKNEIPSMPGVFQYSIDRVGEAIDALLVQGVDKIILFGIPAEKDELATNTYSHDGIIQKALQTLKKEYPQLLLITDVCFCEYTTHGHCGVIVDNEVHNDNTLELLAKQAVSHAESGADMVAPSGMMDNMVGRIRTALDESGYEDMPIMSYAVKYASAFYGPFRDAVDSTPQFGNRKGYQMDPANLREALSEAELDVTEGADILMVKPALAYLDVVKEAKATFNLPIACYNVSGEYSMLKAAAKMGWINHDDVLMESLLAMKRAGADMIITYSAGEAAALLKQQN
ncbi:MAG: porphobilinogen synthase [Candidatus Marinimicrobia bacterium]|nr:porphobilinogen synthase [Candidatus Neomarinimicrobiota bacterium]MDP6936097.1 porphobilinogen synthase [Candidatus Neomarinimicrobiota bacterium]